MDAPLPLVGDIGRAAVSVPGKPMSQTLRAILLMTLSPCVEMEGPHKQPMTDMVAP